MPAYTRKFRDLQLDEDLILDEAKSLPNATTQNSTNAVKYIRSNASMTLRFYANTAIDIDTASVFTLEVKIGDGTTQASVYGTSGKAFAYSKSASEDAFTKNAGELMFAYPIDRDLLGDNDYISYTIITDEDLSLQKFDAVLIPN